MNEEELIIIGIKWLNHHYEERDLEMTITKGLAARYAQRQFRVISRAIAFIESSPENLQWLHDWLMENGKSLEQDVFNLFWEIWSREYKKQYPKHGRKTITVPDDVDWTIVALKEMKNE